MNEPKPFASLSSSLLARKGHAKPAMRPQAFHISGDLSRPAIQHEDDLGWNDMGYDAHAVAVPAPAPAPFDAVPVADVPPPADPVPINDAVMNGQPAVAVVPPVVEQHTKLAENFEAPVAAPPMAAPVGPARRAAAGTKPKAAFTLRLDAERHLRLRLVCAVQHRSAQQVVTQALDEFLARHPGIEAAVQQAR